MRFSAGQSMCKRNEADKNNPTLFETAIRQARIPGNLRPNMLGWLISIDERSFRGKIKAKETPSHYGMMREKRCPLPGSLGGPFSQFFEVAILNRELFAEWAME
ncbi:hypothetical protein CEXT_190691 [Caerostris extrusa]|uniref:Transposase n=1 Tax=Caerostris extrusa TaxID=172846 RepID=A0AAV4SXM2_CAEEX|nr:hypothetical protein CEXT_190691 [Caerostris extrusa]